MANQLKDLILMAHYPNLKTFAQATNIPYAKLLRYCKKPVTTWPGPHLQQIARQLDLTVMELHQKVDAPVLAPFIKWVGGKRQLLPQLMALAPQHFNTYFEPFIGGGAFLLKLAPKKAVINDFNGELTNAWQMVRDDYAGLVQQLQIHQDHDSKAYYYQIRELDRSDALLKLTATQRAARFIYMNKAGFNGLWRVNLAGQSNVPYGGHQQLNLIPDVLQKDAIYLWKNKIEILNQDYQTAVQNVQAGDFVYFDPPYVPLTVTSSFTSYTKQKFGLDQQKQLSNLAAQLVQKGAYVMLSNSDTPLVKTLYDNQYFTIHHVQARRSINSNGNKRGAVGEVIITSNNY